MRDWIVNLTAIMGAGLVVYGLGLVYLPLATASRILERLGCKVVGIPLSYYRKHSFYTMRTDARDRFGTPLEQRFTKQQIKQMMEGAGLVNIRFSDAAPFWCAVGVKH